MCSTNIYSNNKILIVAAHPDDEVLGCGGTIARLAREGNVIYTLILGEGITSRDEARDKAKRAKEIRKLKYQAERANNMLGVKKSFIFDFPDNRFDTVPLLDIIKIVEKVKKQLDPDVIFTHSRGDLNIDHRITFESVLTASRPVKKERLKELYSFEVPSSTEWSAAKISDYFKPNLFIDISNTLKLKVEALKVYSLEVRDFPHPRSPEAIEIIAKRRGIEAGLTAAEAFEIVRLIR